MRRRWILLGLAWLLPATAGAQSYPDRPLRMIVPFAAGGAADLVARVAAQGMSEDLGQPIVVENRGGSGGVIGSQAVLAAAPDGYTLALHSLSSAVLNAALYRNLPFDTGRAFLPVGMIGTVPNIIVINPRLPATTLSAFVDLIRAAPGRYTYASSGAGTIVHLSAHMLVAMAGAQMVHVPYRGSGPAMTDLIAGTVDLMVDTLPTVIPFVRSGQVRALAMTSRQRSATLPEVPTAEEAGLPGYESYNWHGVFVASGTPPAAIARLERAVRNAVAQPSTRQRLVEIGVEPSGAGAEELGAFWRDQMRIWIPVVRSSGATAE